MSEIDNCWSRDELLDRISRLQRKYDKDISEKKSPPSLDQVTVTKQRLRGSAPQNPKGSIRGAYPPGYFFEKQISKRQWCSGNIAAFQAVALGSIPGWRKN